MKTKLIIAATLALGLAACQRDPAAMATYPTEPVLVATAPDGTKLWATEPCYGCDWVYFSSRGAQYTTHRMVGKTSRETQHEVPNAEGQ